MARAAGAGAGTAAGLGAAAAAGSGGATAAGAGAGAGGGTGRAALSGAGACVSTGGGASAFRTRTQAKIATATTKRPATTIVPCAISFLRGVSGSSSSSSGSSSTKVESPGEKPVLGVRVTSARGGSMSATERISAGRLSSTPPSGSSGRCRLWPSSVPFMRSSIEIGTRMPWPPAATLSACPCAVPRERSSSEAAAAAMAAGLGVGAPPTAGMPSLSVGIELGMGPSGSSRERSFFRPSATLSSSTPETPETPPDPNPDPMPAPTTGMTAGPLPALANIGIRSVARADVGWSIFSDGSAGRSTITGADASAASSCLPDSSSPIPVRVFPAIADDLRGF